MKRTSSRGFDSEYLAEVVKSILKNGFVFDTDIEKLRLMIYAYDKDVVTKEEAEALFKINDGVKKSTANTISWPLLFTEGVSDYLLTDETSPGVVDEEEGAWLIRKLSKSGDKLHASEKELLKILKEKATSLPPALLEKCKEWGV
ncbi:MAG: hypothetical protein LBU34_14775 [Planctomycetaceae bacterium]|jgi:hypothetical protein|nr:hypothetical protein [Planctomycetaceae bacterium]